MILIQQQIYRTNDKCRILLILNILNQFRKKQFLNVCLIATKGCGQQQKKYCDCQSIKNQETGNEILIDECLIILFYQPTRIMIQAALLAIGAAETAKKLKEQAEPLGKFFQSLGTATVSGFGAQGTSTMCCHKCGSEWMIHTFYKANTNYSQCNACGKQNKNGDPYIYCPTCSNWGFCAKCVDQKIAPDGCDTKLCAKCHGQTLKSYKFYGLNTNYKNCRSCKKAIGLNCFYWYCAPCESHGYCYKCTMEGKCGIC